MALSPQDIENLKAQGIDPNTLVPADQAQQQSPSALKTLGQHAAVGVGPGAAFMAAFPAGAKAGAGIGALVPGAGETGISEAIGAGLGGLTTGSLASWAAYKAQHGLLNAVAPEFTSNLDASLEAGAKEHPIASVAGDVLGNLPSAEASLPKLSELPFRAALGGGIAAAQPLLQGHAPTLQDVASGAISASVFGKSRFEKEPAPEPINKEGNNDLESGATATAGVSPFSETTPEGHMLDDTSIESEFKRLNPKPQTQGDANAIEFQQKMTNWRRLNALTIDDKRNWLHNDWLSKQIKAEPTAEPLKMAKEGDAGVVGQPNPEQVTTTGEPIGSPQERQQRAMDFQKAKEELAKQETEEGLPHGDGEGPNKATTDENGQTQQTTGKPVSQNTLRITKDKFLPVDLSGTPLEGAEIPGLNVKPYEGPIDEEAKRTGPDYDTRSEAERIQDEMEGNGARYSGDKVDPADLARYQELVAQRRAMMEAGTHITPEGGLHPDYLKAWQESENIKNKYGGMTPDSIKGQGFVPLGKPAYKTEATPVAVADHINSGRATTGSVMKMMAESEGHPFQPLAKWLWENMDSQSRKVKWNSSAILDRSNYQPPHAKGGDEVNMSTIQTYHAPTVIEEALHSMTSAKLPKELVGLKGASLYNGMLQHLNRPATHPAIKSLIRAYIDTVKRTGNFDKLFGAGKFNPETQTEHGGGVAGNPDAVKEALGGDTKGYALGDLHEFIAHAFKNKEFQEMLNKIPAGDGTPRTMWQRVVDAISHLLGIPVGSKTMLDHVLRNSAELIRQERENTNALQVKSSSSIPTHPQAEGSQSERMGQGNQREEVTGAGKTGDRKDINKVMNLFGFKGKVDLSPLGLGSGEGKIAPQQLEGLLANKLGRDSAEFRYLKENGLDNFLFKARSQSELAQWMDNIKPKVEVRKFGEGSLSPERREYNALQHKFDGIHDPHDNTYNWTPEQQADRQRMMELRKTLDKENIRDMKSSHWFFVAPKAEKDMPGYVEIAVVKPLAKKGDAAYDKAERDMTYDHNKPPGQQFPSSHNFPPNTLGFVRGYMETNAKGEKVFHVIEVQSDWAQRIHSFKTAIAKGKFERNPLLNDSLQFVDNKDNTAHVALTELRRLGYKGLWDGVNDVAFAREHAEELAKANYNADKPDTSGLIDQQSRLALKAAIEHARKEGATKIAISDAETAMMSEGHDQRPETIVQQGEYELPHITKIDASWTGKVHVLPENNYEVQTHSGRWIKGDNIHYADSQQIWDDIRKVAPSKTAPPQEQGMRLHYDRTLPKIAEELTGSKGERVEFGEHEKAMEPKPGYEGLDPEAQKLQPRKDLIFRNPDGTPKTSVTARVYDISGKNPDTMTVFGKRHSEGITPEQRELAKEANKTRPVNQPLEATTSKSFGKLGRIAGSVLDNIRAIPRKGAKEVADAYQKALDMKQTLIGKYVNKSVEIGEKLTGAEKEELRRAELKYEATKKLPTDVSPRVYKALSGYVKMYRELGEQHRALNIPINQNGFKRLMVLKEGKIPTMANQSVEDVFRQGTDHAKMKQLEDDYIAWHKKLGYTEEEARENLATQKKSLQGDMTNAGISHQDHFNALRRAMGDSLPPSWREQDPVRNWTRYFDRATTAMAHYAKVESDPKVMATLGATKDAWGNAIPANPEGSLANNKYVQAAIETFHKHPMTGTESTEKGLSSLLTQAFIASPPLEAHVIGSNVSKALLLAPNPSIAMKAVGHALLNLKQGWEHAKEGGLIKLSAGSAKDMFDASLNAHQRMAGVAKAIRNISTLGGKTTEFNAAFQQSYFETLIPSLMHRAAEGDANAARMLKHWDADYQVGKMYDKQGIQQLASIAAKYIHGTGDIRQMPAWMMKESEISGFMQLAHWSVAQTNNFMHDVYLPATKGNLVPLLTGIAGSAAAGYLIKDVREKMQGKRGQIPSLSEIASSEKGLEGNIPLVAYNAIAGMQYAGFAGLFSQLAKYPFDMVYKNAKNSAVFPLDEVASDLADTISQAGTAIVNDPHVNYVDLAAAIGQHLLGSNIKLASIALNQGINHGLIDGLPAQKKQLADKLGELRRFDMVTGLPYNEVDSGSNPYMNLEQKKFKMEQDPAKAVAMLPKMINTIMTTYGSQPDVMLSKLKALKENSYSTFPSLEQTPISFYKYLDYLAREEGEGKAQEALVDYLRHKTINEAKASVVP
jgi:hypothetical protein